MDFNEILKQQLQLSSQQGNGGNNQEHEERHHQLINISRNNPFYGRIMPIHNEKGWFAHPFERVWLTYNGKIVPVIIDTKNPNDEIAKLALRLVSYNYSVEETQRLKVNPRDRYGFRIEKRAEFVGAPANPDTDQPVLTADGTPVLLNYTITMSAYNSILQLLSDPRSLINGKPWSTEFKFITLGETYPMSISLPNNENKYDVRFPSGHVLQPLNFPNWDARDNSGNYVRFDDIDKFNRPLIETSPTFYGKVLDTFKQFLTNNGVIGKQYTAVPPVTNTQVRTQGNVQPSMQANTQPNVQPQAPQYNAQPSYSQAPQVNNSMYAQPSMQASVQPNVQPQAPQYNTQPSYSQAPQADNNFVVGSDDGAVSDIDAFLNGLE